MWYKKCSWIFFACCFFLLLGGVSELRVSAESDALADLAAESGADNVTNSLDWDIQEMLAQFGLDTVGDGDSFTLSAVWHLLGESLTAWIRQPMQLLGSLLTVILLAALFQGMQGGRLEDSTVRMMDYVSALVSAAILTTPLSDCFTGTETALTQGAEFMLLFVPVFAGILAAGGLAGSAVCYQAAVLGLADGLLQIISRVMLPLCTMCFAMAIVDAISPGISIAGLLQLVKKTVTWAMGLLMTIFLGVLSLQNLLSSGTDTAATKTAKYLVSSVVPVVGNAVSDAYSTVQSSLSVLRSSTGVMGIAALCLLFLPPLIQILLYRAVLALSAAMAELFGTARLRRLLQGVGMALGLAFALLVCFGVMFVVATAIGTMHTG